MSALNIYVAADAHGFTNPNTFYLRNEITKRPPVIMSGFPFVLDVALLDEGVIEDLTGAGSSLTLEIKPARSDRDNGVPDQNDPFLIRKELTSGFMVPTELASGGID